MNVADILSDLNDHGFEDTPTERKLAVINETIGDIAGRELWPQLVKTLNLTFAGGSSAPSNWPTDFRAVKSLKRTDKAGVFTEWRSDDFEEQYGSVATQAGDPMLYYFEGNVLNVWPVPANGTTLRMRYAYNPTDVVEQSLASAIWFPPMYHRGIIVNGAVYKLYLMEDDAELSREFERLYEKAYNNMRAALWIRSMDDDYIRFYAEDVDYE